MNIQSFFSGLISLFVGFSALFSSTAPAPTFQPSAQLQAIVASSTHVQVSSSVTVTTDDTDTSSSTEDSSVDSAATIVATSSYPTGSSWLTTLPLGDDKYVTTAPQKGSIYLCHVLSGSGAEVNGSWIHGTTWTPSEKFAVEGTVSWPNATTSSSISGTIRSIKSNDLPTDHTTGIFPIQATDPAHAIDGNPSSIVAQNLSLALPAFPVFAAAPGCIYGEVGVMNDGVWLFDGFDAENRDALAHEMQDNHDGHPNQEGYHYHGFTSSIKNISVSTVTGFALDGFPITGPLLPSGKYLTTSDLDECHGMTSTITLDGASVLMYHYVLTQDFPYSVSCFKGTSTFKPTPQTNSGGQGSPQGQQQMQGGTPPAPPQEAIDICVGKDAGAPCVVGKAGVGLCESFANTFACKPM